MYHVIGLSTIVDWSGGDNLEQSIADVSESEEKFEEETLSFDDVEDVDEDREDTEEDDDEHEDIIGVEFLNLGDGCTVTERLNRAIEKKNKVEKEN